MNPAGLSTSIIASWNAGEYLSFKDVLMYVWGTITCNYAYENFHIFTEWNEHELCEFAIL